MAKKFTAGKHLTPNELVGVLSDCIRNVRNGTAQIDEVNAISRCARGICDVTSTQMRVQSFIKENPELVGSSIPMGIEVRQ